MDESPAKDPVAAREILLTFYKENALQSRSYEQQRQTVTTTVAIAAAIVLGLSALAPDTASRIPAGLFLIVLGGHGFLACLRHYERGRLHVERVHAVREEISRSFPVLDLYAEANQKHARRFPVLSEKTARTNLIWLGLHVAVAGLGVLVVLL